MICRRVEFWKTSIHLFTNCNLLTSQMLVINSEFVTKTIVQTHELQKHCITKIVQINVPSMQQSVSAPSPSPQNKLYQLNEIRFANIKSDSDGINQFFVSTYDHVTLEAASPDHNVMQQLSRPATVQGNLQRRSCLLQNHHNISHTQPTLAPTPEHAQPPKLHRLQMKLIFTTCITAMAMLARGLELQSIMRQ